MIKLKIVAFLLISLFSFGTSVFAQKHTIIIYRYNQDSIKKDSFHLHLMQIFGTHTFGASHYYPGKLISFNQKKGYSETIYDYTVKDTSCAIIGDAFGQMTFVVPGDTMIMNVTGHKLKLVRNKYPLPWFRTLTYEGKNKFVYTLFDSLPYVAGDLRFSPLGYGPKNNLGAFCETADSIYTQRISFLEQYCNRYNIAKPFKELVKTEIYAAYIDHLLTPLDSYDSLTINDYSKHYREIILRCRFNDPSIYFKTTIYSSVAYTFASLVLPTTRTSMPRKDSDLKSVYEIIKHNFPDSIRNHLLTCHLSSYLNNKKVIYPSFDSLLTDFKTICKNHLYTHLLDSLNVARKVLGVKTYSFKDAMSSEIMDTKDQLSDVKHLFKSKPVLLICWASWCGPCIKEIPSEKKLQDVYGDRVDFIYLSFDSSKKSWLDKLLELKMNEDNNYWLTKYFTSDFANFYKLNTIPNYFLYDKNGNRVALKELRPSDDGFKRVLEKVIN